LEERNGMITTTGRWWTVTGWVTCLLIFGLPLVAQERSEIQELKAMLAEQQRQIDELRRELHEKSGSAAPAVAQQPDASVGLHKNIGAVASTTAVVPSGASASIRTGAL